MVPDRDGALALIVEYDSRTESVELLAYTPVLSSDDSSIAAAYVLSCDPDLISRPPRSISPTYLSYDLGYVPPQSPSVPLRSEFRSESVSANLYNLDENPLNSSSHDSDTAESFLSLKKKYKPVALKVRPLQTDLPEKFRIQRRILGDPLEGMPTLNPNPPPFTPGERYTAERRKTIRAIHTPFLNDSELDVLDDLVKKQELGLAWEDSERGTFRRDFFPPIDIPTVPHKPWVLKNIPIPPGIYKEICTIIKSKIDSGVYEPSNSSYRSKWFPVLKKDGVSLRIVHSLEPLNAVTIQHSGVPPIPEQLAEQFAGRPCLGLLDMYVGYDEREIAESSRDLTTFQTPFGAHRLVTLPMGWSNSVPIFHDDVTFILQAEIPHCVVPYIDDVPIKGPESDYRLPDGTFETIPENRNVRRFVWEHLQVVNRIIQRVKHAGGTFSGKKLQACVEEGVVIGHRCTPRGRLPEDSRVSLVLKWAPCKDLSSVRAFLGTVGVARIFIKDFAKKAHPLVNLTRKGVPFEWGVAQDRAMDELKQALVDSPALRAIDYESDAAVILGVDTSWMAVGYLLCQQDREKPAIRYYNRFGSITLNDREQRFSQPKLEIYGLYRALRALRLWLIGVRNLVVEVDARYIKGMLANPDIMPSASINRWIMSILMFHFTLVHVPGERHAPDGLSRRPPQPDDPPPEEDDFEDWIDNLYAFVCEFSVPPKLGDAPLLDPEPFPPEAGHWLYEEERVPTADVLAGELQSSDAPGATGLSYDDFPRSPKALATERQLPLVRAFLADLVRPEGLSESRFRAFYHFATQFALDQKGDLWKKEPSGAHRKVLPPERRPEVLRELHDRIGHRGFFATRSFVSERFWWPDMKSDIQWYVRSCHLCQIRQTTKIIIPPTVSFPAAPMFRVHMDSAHMPGPYKFLVHARCATTSWPEARALTSEGAKALGEFIWQDILCRWNAIGEIVSDNGTPWVKALEYLSTKYHISHIRISGYNSRANGVVESPHHPMRDILFKATEGDGAKWSTKLHSVLWADRATVRRRMGCSPYFAVTGTHPVLPLDIVEATYLVPTPEGVLTTEELVANRAVALQKRTDQIAHLRSEVYAVRVAAAKRIEAEHKRTVRDFDCAPNTLVLVRNTAIEKSLNRKMKPRYLGPYLVVARNRGGAYVLSELDGAVFDRPIAAFRVLPYLARTDELDVPKEWLDADTNRLREMEASTDRGEGAEDVELLDLE